MALQHKRSSVTNKRPDPIGLSDGQLALNLNALSTGLFYRNASNELVKVGPVHVGSGAPNASPATGGATGNTVGEQWLDTTGGNYVLKVYDGTAWRAVEIEPGSARQLLQTNAAGTDVEFTSNIDVPGTLDVTGAATFDSSVTVAGDLTVNGTTTTIDTTTLVVEDKNIEMGAVTTPTDTTADGGGITLKGATDKTINWVQSTGCWTFNQPTNFNNHVRIDSSGNVGIGTSSPGMLLDVQGASDPQLKVSATNTGTNSAGLYIENQGQRNWQIWADRSTDTFRIGNNSRVATNFVINSSGNVLIRRTANTDTATLCVDQDASGANVGISTITTNTGTRYHLLFRNGNGQVGAISTNGSSTTYAAQSDYRLKENVVDLDGAIGRVKQLAPKRFNFIADADTTVDGFLAHEAQAVVPEAVTGTHNEVDGDGNAVMQGIDQSKLVPLLTAALQEAIAKIETLEQRLTDAGL